MALGIGSHLVLDLFSHARDIALSPIQGSRRFGRGGRREKKPVVAFVFETIYGIFCWWVYRGGMALFWIIVVFNLANASFFIKALPGPERLMAHRPFLITAIIGLQIIVTAVLVGLLS